MILLLLLIIQIELNVNRYLQLAEIGNHPYINENIPSSLYPKLVVDIHNKNTLITPGLVAGNPQAVDNTFDVLTRSESMSA